MSNPFFSQAELAERAALRQGGMAKAQYSIPWFNAGRQPLFIFGAGVLTETLTVKMLKDANVLGIIDNNPALWGKEYNGHTVLSPGEAFARDRQAVVIVSVVNDAAVQAIMTQCQELGFTAVPWLMCFIRSDPRRYNEDFEMRPGAELGLALWDDAESVETYRAVVRFKAGLNPEYLPKKARGDTYFQEFVPLAAYRCFADLGAFDGDTLRNFLTYTKGRYDAYYAFEPMTDLLADLRRNAAADSRITVIPAAASDKSGNAAMTLESACPVISDSGTFPIKVTTLDEALTGKSITFLKMDIEGFELAALRGGEKLIRSERPVLAVSVYHRPEDIWDIPLYLRDLGLGYRLRLRHHFKYAEWDTVCYALPNGLDC